MFTKHFTVAEANKMLPLVRMIVQDISSNYQEVVDRKERIESLKKRHRRNSHRQGLAVYEEEVEQAERQLSHDIERLEGYVDELRKLGVQLKDPAVGLIDFPGMMEEREVFLCWKLGEAEVAHWHEIDSGFDGRQSLLEGSATPDSHDNL
jgi:hypothetical protein